MLSNWLSLIGLGLDIYGFFLIAWNLLKHPDDRPAWGGGAFEWSRDRIAFICVIVGFVFQAAAQMVEMWS